MGRNQNGYSNPCLVVRKAARKLKSKLNETFQAAEASDLCSFDWFSFM